MKEFPPFRLDTSKQCLRRCGDPVSRRIPLTPKAFAVLSYLVEHAEEPAWLHQDELLEAVWPDTLVQPEVLKYQIADIRGTLGDNPKSPFFLLRPCPGEGTGLWPQSERVRGDGGKRGARRKAGGQRTRAGPLAEPPKGLEGQRQIVFITGEPGIGKTALSTNFSARPPPRNRPSASPADNASKASGERKPITRCWRRWVSCAMARGETRGGASGRASAYLAGAVSGAAEPRTAPDAATGDPGGHPGAHAARDPGALDYAEPGSAARSRVREICNGWIPRRSISSPPSARQRTTTEAPGDRHRAAGGHGATRTSAKEAQAPDLLVTSPMSVKLIWRRLRSQTLAEYMKARSLREAALPEGFAELIHRHSEGNPLVMVATLDHMTERGLVSRENGKWSPSGSPSGRWISKCRRNLRQTIEANIERLTSEQQRMLEVASVNGVLFSASVNAIPAALDEEKFRRTLRRIVAPPANGALGGIPQSSRTGASPFATSLHTHCTGRFLPPADAGAPGKAAPAHRGAAGEGFSPGMKAKRRLNWRVTSSRVAIGGVP